MPDQGELLCLIKPQFEAGREKVGKKGVVRDPQIHKEVIDKVVRFADQTGLVPHHLDFSPIKGPEGNIEYLLHLKKSQTENQEDKVAVEQTVMLAHQTLS
jgi:23S rRNA (cytidine1920-2'-O)/16S rRNA (cytidine1409-2'-O)-methyltransferase